MPNLLPHNNSIDNTTGKAKMIQNYKAMSVEELRTAMLAVIPDNTWHEELAPTPENLNWMFVVFKVHDAKSADDLQDLLAILNQQYAGPISIHEGWGGTEADSNLELITEKLRFDWYELSDEYTAVYQAAVALGWLDSEEYNDSRA
jgi:hypothetical protein